MANTLYICYFGVREPLVQTQVLPYLREIGRGDSTAETPRREEEKIKISLLTFEPNRGDEDLVEFERVRAELAAEGIEWVWLPYHKRLSAIATAWDIFRGAFYIWRRIGRFDVLHGRVHVPTLMAALARKFSLKRPKILFDIRGFFPEEYTDAGIWPENGLLYRGAKRVERWLMKEADAFVVLTERAKEILFDETEKRPVEVIPCCVDMNRFASATPESRKAVREELGIGDRRVGVYVGAFGGWYMAEETAEFFGAMRKRDPETFVMVLTQSKREMIEPLLKAQGFEENDYFIAKVPSTEIPRYLSAADLAVSFIKPCYSKQASSPTKNAEYLACGLPIVANAGIGDVDQLVEGHKVGSLLDQFDSVTYSIAIEQTEELGDVSHRCRETAAGEFDLEHVGGVRYRRLYQRILNS
jgi:Glycosyltransferase